MVFANIMIGTLGIVFANLQNYYTKIAVNSIWIQLITGATKKYIRSNRGLNIRKLEDLTSEQMSLSGQMIDEMIAIYNKYYITAHRSVVYDPKDGTGKIILPVIPPTEAEFVGE